MPIKIMNPIYAICLPLYLLPCIKFLTKTFRCVLAAVIHDVVKNVSSEKEGIDILYGSRDAYTWT